MLDTMLDGYQFNNKALLKEALTHPSLCREPESRAQRGGIRNYERLEFLGDAVLDMVISAYLFTAYPEESEGDLAKRRSALVCGETISRIALSHQLGHSLLMTEGEDSTGGRGNAGNLANALEAIIGALFLDGGLEVATRFIHTHWLPFAKTMTSPPRDPKTLLQEWAQGHKKPIPSYRVVRNTGPSHAPVFTVSVLVEGVPSMEGMGSSKRLAEREAARLLLEHINK